MMKNRSYIIYALLMFTLGACSSAKFSGVNQVEDDVYWSRKDEAKTGVHYQDVEKWNKSKGPNPGNQSQNNAPIYVPSNAGSSMPAYSSAPSSTSVQTEPNALDNPQDEQRAQEAYKTWLSKRGMETVATPDTVPPATQNNYSLDNQKDEERYARRFGTERNYYYDDPYFNSLSTNWGWTSFYAPVVRPGFYNWAPGWNVGLSWNTFTGWNVGMGYGMGFGAMPMTFGYSPLFAPVIWDPWYGYMNPYAYGFYNPYAYGFYNPWAFGYYHPFYGGWGYNNWGYGCRGYRNGYYNNHNDVVTNRPMMRPRQSMGSSTPGSSANRPMNAPGQLKTGSATPAANNPGVIRDGLTPTASRPVGSAPAYTPARQQATPTTNKPGGDLVYDPNGKPVYVPSRGSAAPSPSSNYNPGTYSNRPGGELRTGNDGRQVYVPSRPSNAPSPSPSNNYTPTPSRNNSGGTYNEPRPRNNTPSPSTPSYSPSQRNTPSPSPSYSPPTPAPSRSGSPAPAPSAPRPSSSGGGGGSRSGGGSPGGIPRPR